MSDSLSTFLSTQIYFSMILDSKSLDLTLTKRGLHVVSYIQEKEVCVNETVLGGSEINSTKLTA